MTGADVAMSNPGTMAAAQPRTRWWRQLSPAQRVGLVLTEFALIAALWQWVIEGLELVNPLFLPPPSRMLSGGADLISSGELWVHLRVSAFEWFIGYGAATFFGVVLGLAMGGWRPFTKLAGPWLWALYAAPWVAFQPLFTVWFGYGPEAVVFLVLTAAIFPILFNTAAGVEAVDTDLTRCASVFGARTGHKVWRIILPATTPFIFVGLRHGAVSATLGLLVGEIVGGSVGIGALISLKTAQFQVGAAFFLILVTVLFTSVFNQALLRLGRWVAPWYFMGARG